MRDKIQEPGGECDAKKGIKKIKSVLLVGGILSVVSLGVLWLCADTILGNIVNRLDQTSN